MVEFKYLEGIVTLQYDEPTCIGCSFCATVCPHGVFIMNDKKAAITDRDRCMECGACAKNCPVEAIAVDAGVGCASAIIYSWLTGNEPSCDCESGGC